MKTDLSGLCKKDEEYQNEWKIFFEECFDANGNYLEETAKEIFSTMKERKNKRGGELAESAKTSKSVSKANTFGE